MDRRDIFNQLSEINQDLLYKIHPHGYINADFTDPIEEYIIAYDTDMGNVDIVFLLAIRIGAEIFPPDDPDVFIYSIFEKYIDIQYGERIPDVPLPSEVLKMDIEGFRQFVQRFNNIFRLSDTDSKLGSYYDQRLKFLFELYDNPEDTDNLDVENIKTNRDN